MNNESTIKDIIIRMEYINEDTIKFKLRLKSIRLLGLYLCYDTITNEYVFTTVNINLPPYFTLIVTDEITMVFEKLEKFIISFNNTLTEIEKKDKLYFSKQNNPK
ncbi:hypothetical protein MrNuV_ORF049 [Macrobrachium rosenbergii nudivirus]|nr:hypothetical protein MrNuV_ORF049 [Macrobrachium rosenbergii nudivirus]